MRAPKKGIILVKTAQQIDLWMTEMNSPVGVLRLVASASGLRHVHWPNDTNSLTPWHRVDSQEHPTLRNTVEQLNDYFTGTLRQFHLPLDPRGTEFQILAWNALATIPYGHTATYSSQAARIGRPTAVRAIGAANGKNPLAIVLPCHRVIGADGSLTGFAGGLDAKRQLLDHEQQHAGLTLFAIPSST